MAQEIKNIVRLDIVDGKPRTFVAEENLQNGYFLEIKGKAKNDILGVETDYEAYKVEKANANTNIKTYYTYTPKTSHSYSKGKTTVSNGTIQRQRPGATKY